MKTHLSRLPMLALAASALALGSNVTANAQAVEKLTIVIFSPPSLGALLPPVIKAQKLDIANGLDITFEERPPDAYSTQFNSGEFKVGGSASLTTLGLADVRGVKVTYLFNLFDYWGTIVTSREGVKSLKDLEGKELVGARSTTNYQMYEFFAKKQGVDVSKIKVVNTAPPGLISYAIADRADAVQIWEPAYTLMMTKKPSIRTIDLNIAKTWKDAGGGTIPYLGVGAHTDWANANPDKVQKLYTIYKAAVEWVQKNPDEAAPLLAKGAAPEELKAVAAMIKSNERLAMRITKAGEVKKDIQAVFKAGMEINYLPSMPSDASIYDKPLK
jgi:ABC-type nitrate/sulfonate/bicarbonate transport system substrate-binding protein